MISISISEVLFGVVGIVTVFAVLLGVVMVIYTNRRQTRYDAERHRVELEMMRRSIESQMYSLNEKLLATEDRWRDVNHLLISSQNRQPDLMVPLKENPSSSFLVSSGISAEDLKIERDLVFVLTPFHPGYKDQYETISSTCASLGLRAMRGDEQFVSGDIFPHILRLIVRARIIVANIDGRNPNVFYELGIAQALGKPVILIAPTPEDVPFDIRTKRLVLFQSLGELREKLKDELARVVVATEHPVSLVIEAKNRMPELLPEARLLLLEASHDPHGVILFVRSLGGAAMQTNGKNFIASSERREVAKWEHALEDLKSKGLVVERGHKGEMFELSNKGYEIADLINR